jgi:hypothetical protein
MQHKNKLLWILFSKLKRIVNFNLYNLITKLECFMLDVKDYDFYILYLFSSLYYIYLLFSL